MEIWKDIEKFNNEYQISTLGRIRSKEAVIIKSNGVKYKRVSKVLKPALSKDGYLKGSVCVNKKMIPYRVHRLVAECFIFKPNDKIEVNHINGIKTDNTVKNLEWVTRSENIIHALKTGLLKVKKGSEKPESKMTEETVKKIYELKKKGIQRKFILQELKISVHMYKDLMRGKTWKHV